jgi:hypothetical protein
MILLAVSLVAAEVASPRVGACHLYWRAHAAVVLLSACRPNTVRSLQLETVSTYLVNLLMRFAGEQLPVYRMMLSSSAG